MKDKTPIYLSIFCVAVGLILICGSCNGSFETVKGCFRVIAAIVVLLVVLVYVMFSVKKS